MMNLVCVRERERRKESKSKIQQERHLSEL